VALPGCGGGSHTPGTAAADASGAPVQGAATTATGTATTGAAETTRTNGTAATTPTGSAGSGSGVAGGAGNASGGGSAGGGSQGSANNPTPGRGGSSGGGSPATHTKGAVRSGAAVKPATGTGSGTSGSNTNTGVGGPGATSGAGSSPANSGIPYEVSTISMEPTYKAETTVYYNPTRTTPQIGEVIVFYLPAGAEGGSCAEVPAEGAPCRDPLPGLTKKIAIKRVVGLPGDTIAIREGRVIRNGLSEPEPATTACGPDEQTACEYPKAITVPAGHYYVMSDNRGAAKEDSRVFGAIPQEAVLGTVEGG
jgi:signal peptidase I